eukprot:TRINITY_DN54922_c0_g1_i2.p1 TRINITY_DN54922_c0_g1~~TRINITY_DN54922_c0_g1_i2.p1  ORF type:complete len:252 (-),score=24.22 TRINITY_DN54922_c0_g1_i2:64-819(-)
MPELVIPSEVSSLEGCIDRLVTQKRGAACVASSMLFSCALRALGFESAYATQCRTVGQPAHRVSWPMHVLVVVPLSRDITYLCDIGNGPASPRCPLLLNTEVDQNDGQNTFRIVDDFEGLHELNNNKYLTITKNGEPTVYLNPSLPEMEENDWEMMFTVASHPASPWKKNFVLYRHFLDGHRTYLSGDRYTVIPSKVTNSPPAKKRTVENVEEFHKLVNEELGMPMTTEQANRVWHEMPRTGMKTGTFSRL